MQRPYIFWPLLCSGPTVAICSGGVFLMNLQKWKILFRGHVQGVGFRYQSAQLAKRHPIVGWVKNLPDGRVELHIQGKPADLEFYLEAIELANPGRILDMEKTVGAVDLSIKGFEIRY